MLRNRRSHEVCTPRLESGCCSPQLEKAEATVKTQHSQKQISKKNFFTCYSDRAGLPLAFSAWRWRMLNHIGMRGTHRQDWPVPSADDTERQLHFQVVEAFFQTKILHRIPICKMYLRRAIFFFLEKQEVHETFLWGNSLTIIILGISLAVLWLRILAFIAEGMGSIPGQGAKILYAMRCSQKNKKWKTERERKRRTIILDVIRWAWSSNVLRSYTVLRTECFKVS